MDELSIVNLGSGSKGNATVIWNRHGGLLIDSGFSRKELLARMDAAGVPRDAVTAVILTHEHEDHARGVRLACDTFCAPLYISATTLRWFESRGKKLPGAGDLRRFMPGCPIHHAQMLIEPFQVMHDAVDPVGLVVRYGELKVGVATDIGKINMLALERLRGCDYLMLESNYDKSMLLNSNRTLALKRRIMGMRGHLDNVAAAEILSELLTQTTRHLTLAHLSGECNSREIVENLFVQRLEELERGDIFLSIADQATPSQITRIPAGNS